MCHAVWSCVPYAPSQTCCVVLALFLVAFEGQSGVCLLIYAFCRYLSVPGTGDTEGVEGNLQNFPVKLRSQNLLHPKKHLILLHLKLLRANRKWCFLKHHIAAGLGVLRCSFLFLEYVDSSGGQGGG